VADAYSAFEYSCPDSIPAHKGRTQDCKSDLSEITDLGFLTMFYQYYKPWELLPSQEEGIKAQIAEAEATIEEENEQWDIEHPATEQKEVLDEHNEPLEPAEAAVTNGHGDTVGSPADKEEKPSSPNPAEDTNMSDTTTPYIKDKPTEPIDGPKDHGDDGGEVVEGEEDTVIY